MARIRSIKPKFWDDVKIGRISRDARLLYIGLWTFADDLGVVIADPVWLKSKIFPYDKIQLQQLEAWLKVLEETGFISHLFVKSESFYYLPTFSRHQVINKPNLEDVNVDKELLDSILDKTTEQSGINHGTITEQSGINHGTITEQSGTIIGEEKDRDSSTPYNPPRGEMGDIPDEFISLWDSFKGKRKSLADDYKDFCKKTDGLIVDYVKLQYHSQFAKNVYFQTWLNDSFPKKFKRDIDLSFVEPSLQPVMAEWLAYKSERGQTYRQQGLKACYSKLRELSNGEPDIARKIIRQSMANNWAGLFPLKTTNGYGRSTKNQPPSPDELAQAVAEGISRAHTRQEWE